MPYIDDQFEGLSEHAKELKKWDLPKRQGGYRPDYPQEFPKLLYRAVKIDGKCVVEGQSCWAKAQDASHEAILRGQGWSGSVIEAKEAYEIEQREFADAAAERVYGDRKMSEKAQREAAAVDAASATHVPEIKEKPIAKRKPGRPKGWKRAVPAVATE